MYDVLTWLESSSLGHAMRSLGVWAYGLVNLFHILGIAALFGAVLVLDLRLMGAWRRVPLAALARPLVPVAAIGFGCAAVSGVCLIVTNATEYAGNPFLLIKFPAIAVALANVALLGSSRAWRERGTRELTPPERRQLAVSGGVSLLAWLTAVSAGRMIGYW
jgi:hypothetical protein